MRRLRGLGLVALLGAIASCTFGGLGDYDVEPCTPALSQSADVCNRLDPGPTCNPFQCDPASQRCVRRPRDDDRDGDPTVACGGGDCDDANPSNRSGVDEQCDGKDNNCDGIVDEFVVAATPAGEVQKLGTLPSTADVTFASDNGSDVVASLLVQTGGGSCIQAVRMQGQNPGFLFDGCSFLSSEPTLAPRQPYVQLAESGGAALFVLTSGCGKGALSYRYSSGIAGKADLACNATAAGVALPALAFFADDPKTAMALYFDVPLSARDALDDCGAAAPAPLRALLVEKAASASPALAKAVERTLAPDSISLRPPGVAPVAGTAVVLVAAPAGNDVAVWSVTRDALKAGGADPGVITIPDLVGARSAAIAVSPTGSVAVAAELGCPGSQSVRLALGNFDAPTASVGFSASIEVAPTGALATQPAVAWNAARSEWLVTWLSSGGLMQARRFTPEGAASGGAVDIVSPSGGGTPSSDGTLYVLGAESGNSSFNAFSLGCN